MQSSRAQLLELLDGGTKENTFEAYLKRTFCAENLYFYRKVISYESLSVEMETERKKLALEIWNKFVAPDSEDQVNLDGSIVDGTIHLIFPYKSYLLTIQMLKRILKKREPNSLKELRIQPSRICGMILYLDFLIHLNGRTLKVRKIAKQIGEDCWINLIVDQNEQIESKSEEKTIQIDASPKTRKRARSEVDVSLIQPDSDQPLKKRLRNYVTPVRRLKETPVKVTKGMAAFL